MLKYDEIIKKLAFKQKIELLSNINAFSESMAQISGTPSIKVERLEDVFLKYGISLREIVRSWDTALISKITYGIIKEEEKAGNGANVYICPSMKPSIMGAYREALSEDSFFNRSIVEALSAGISDAGALSLLDGFWLTAREIAELDDTPDERFINEIMVYPYKMLCERDEVAGVCVSYQKNFGAYAPMGEKLLNEISSGILKKGDRKFAYISHPDETVKALLDGAVLLNGYTVALESAYSRFCELSLAVKNGECPIYVLDDSSRSGEAISMQKIDELVDRLIDYVSMLKDPSDVKQTEDPIEEAPVFEDPRTYDTASSVATPMSETFANAENQVAFAEAVTENEKTVEDLPFVPADAVAEGEEPAPEETVESVDAVTVEAETVEDLPFVPADAVAEDEELAPEEIVESVDAVTVEAGTVEDLPFVASDAVAEDEESVAEELFTSLETQKGEANGSPLEELLLEASLQSTILLKNEKNNLPINKRHKVLVVGSLFEDEEHNSSFFDIFTRGLTDLACSRAYGYKMNGERSDVLLNEAVSLASSVDDVIVFLSVPDGERTLMTNQLVLLDALALTEKNVTALIRCNDVLDMSFDDAVTSIVLAPIYSDISARALSMLISGTKNFSARLTKTFRDNNDAYYAKERLFKKTRGIKVGSFLDYKRDTGALPNYCFGFGKTYGEVKYRSISYKNHENSISVLLGNNGRTDVCEVVQIYSGMDHSSIVRPEKELRAFGKITVEFGASKTLKLENLDFRAYNRASDAFEVEEGSYHLYASCGQTDVKMSDTQQIQGVTFENDGEYISDYLENFSNIKDREYYLEDRITAMNAYKRTQKISIASFAAAFILSIIAIIVQSAGGVVLGVLAACAVAFGIVEIVRSSKQKAFYRQEMARMNEHEDHSEMISVDSIKALFKDEFKLEYDAKAENSTSADDRRENIVDITHSDLAQYSDFLKNCGLEIEKIDCCAFIAALSSSRLVFSSTLAGELLEKLVCSTASFFGGEAVSDIIDARYQSEDKLLYIVDEDGNKTPSLIGDFIARARTNPEKAHFILLKGVNMDNAESVLSPYVRYFVNPYSASVQFTINGEDIVLPSNLWFIAEYAEKPEAISAYINEVATYMPQMNISECEGGCELFDINITVSAFDSLVKKTRTTLPENEELWKKLDAVEGYASKRVGYTIGNRFFMKIEHYLSVFLKQREVLLPKDESITPQDIAISAMDYTMATSVMPALYSAISVEDTEEIKNLYFEIEQNFGEDKMPICKYMYIKHA